MDKKVKIKLIPCEVYSRVVGYYRPVSSWNKGKQEEFKSRAVFSIKLNNEELNKNE